MPKPILLLIQLALFQESWIEHARVRTYSVGIDAATVAIIYNDQSRELHAMTRTEKLNEMDRIDKQVGISRVWFGVIWWTIAAWVASAIFNIYSRTQQFKFALPWAPDFKDAATPYGVAAIGVIAGAPLFWMVALGLRYYALRWGSIAGGWPERVPTVSKDLTIDPNRPFPRLIQALILVIAILVPLVGQCHFVDKFLSGESLRMGSHFANSWHEHLFQPLGVGDACSKFTYDGMGSFAFCEFYEPWVVVLFTGFSFVLAALSMHAVTPPRNWKRPRHRHR
jgi:hypothetical protein